MGGEPGVSELERGCGWPPIIRRAILRVKLGAAADPLANDVGIVEDGGAVAPPREDVPGAIVRADPDRRRLERRPRADGIEKVCRVERKSPNQPFPRHGDNTACCWPAGSVGVV